MECGDGGHCDGADTFTLRRPVKRRRTGSRRAGVVVQTSQGDPDVGGDETNITVPADPAPNTEFPGPLETVVTPFGTSSTRRSRTPTARSRCPAVGDVNIGAVTCGVGGTTTTTTSSPATTTTRPGLFAPACAALRDVRNLLAARPFLGVVLPLVDSLLAMLRCQPNR